METAEHRLGKLGNESLLVVARRCAPQLGLGVVDYLDSGFVGQHDEAHQQ